MSKSETNINKPNTHPEVGGELDVDDAYEKLEQRQAAKAQSEADETRLNAEKAKIKAEQKARKAESGNSASAPSGAGKKTKWQLQKRGFNTVKIVSAGVIAALYVLLCLPFASFSFGIVQFRLAEALCILPVFSSAAVPGLFLGCFLSNLLNPQNLGLIDIALGSLTTLLAAFLTFKIASPYRRILLAEQRTGVKSREANLWKKRFLRFVMLLPPIILNAVIVGSYLPYLTMERSPNALEVIGSIASIFFSQTLVIFTLGLALLLALENLHFPVENV